MKATKLALTAGVLAAAGTLVLTGCEPVTVTGSTGSTGTSGSSGVACDPNGFGPFNGCDSANSSSDTNSSSTSSSRQPAEADTSSCQADESGLDLSTDRFNEKDGQKPAVDDEKGCGTDNSSEPEKETPDQDKKGAETAETRVNVTVTWIVVSIKVTGFRECVIGLRDESTKSDDDFSRRITTPEDCKAQQVDAVYRPVDK